MTKKEIAKEFIAKCYANVKRKEDAPRKKEIQDMLQAEYPTTFPTAKSAENAVQYATTGRKKIQPPLVTESEIPRKTEQNYKEYIDELEELLDIKKNIKIEVYDIVPKESDKSGKSQSVAIALASDWHVDEVVNPESIMELNEFNQEIAKKRINNFFINFCKLTSHAQRSYNIHEAIIAFLGDIISGWIHEELQQTNWASPPQAISFAETCILSGMKYLQENMKVDKISVICITGNHARLTKKNQYANATKVNYEYFMYKHIEQIAKLMELTKFEFVIPEAEMKIINLYGKRIYCYHGSHIKFFNGIAGVALPIGRWFANLPQVLKVDMAWIGHFHTSVLNSKFIVNGALKGYDAFALGNAFSYEAPQQTMLIWNEKRGLNSYTPIYVD